MSKPKVVLVLGDGFWESDLYTNIPDLKFTVVDMDYICEDQPGEVYDAFDVITDHVGHRLVPVSIRALDNLESLGQLALTLFEDNDEE